MRIYFYAFVASIIAVFLTGCDRGHSSQNNQKSYEAWLTDVDNNVLFQKTDEILYESESDEALPVVNIDSETSFQTIDGFGYTFNGGSARLLNEMDADAKKKLLNEIYGNDDKSIGVNYIRLSVGASDLSDSVFSYNDLRDGETDLELKKFNMDMERVHLIPILKEVLAINPDILIMGSPWSPPAWMKTNNSLKGGSLKPECFEVYADYLVKYIQEMGKEGIVIDALTIQNEPLHPGNNPSMYMSAEDQALFIKKNLGPAFESAGIKTKIIIYDHNADHVEYPISILNDAEAKKYIDGSAFHLYGGQIDALAELYDAHPDRNIYFTEQWVGAPSNLKGDFNWHINNLIIGATRNWCKTILEWNLAADENQHPHTDNGGCLNCLGAITLDGDEIERNAAYYIIAHASKFVSTGSVRVGSNIIESLPNVAFKTPDGSCVVIVQNTQPANQLFEIKLDRLSYTASLPAEAVATFVFN